MSTHPTQSNGSKQSLIGEFTDQKSDYEVWRESITPPENPMDFYADNEYWNQYINDGIYAVDWEHITDEQLYTSIYSHAKENKRRTIAERVAKRTLEHANVCFHPEIISVPVSFVDIILRYKERNILCEEENIFISHLKRGLIRSTKYRSERYCGATYSPDWDAEERYIKTNSNYIQSINDATLLKKALKIVESLNCQGCGVEQQYIDVMYSRQHTPENRENTLFKNFKQENINSAVSYTMSSYFCHGLYEKPNERRWGKFFEVISNDEIIEAIVTVAKKDIEGSDEEPKYNGKAVYRSNCPHHFEVITGFMTRHDEGFNTHNIGIVFSHLTDDELVQTIERLDNENKLTTTILHASLTFGATQNGRERIYEEYKDRRIFPENENSITLQFTDDFEEWKKAFVNTWRKRGGTKVHTLMQAGTTHIGANKEASKNDVQIYADGRPFDQLSVSDSFIEHVTKLYNETQEYYSRYDKEKKRTIYRGLSENALEGKYVPATVESWSEHKKEARKFVQNHEHILKKEVKIPNVLATWESLGDVWPEEKVKGCKEWIVIGAGVI